MIALTQEKREEKIKRLNKIVSWADSYGADHNVMIPALEAKEMAEAYIASLTASAVGSFHIYEQKVDATTDYVRDGEWPIDEGELLVYAAPPVPEIKLIQPTDFIGKWNNSDDCPLAGLSAKSAANKAVSAYAQEIKRLNGLGE